MVGERALPRNLKNFPIFKKYMKKTLDFKKHVCYTAPCKLEQTFYYRGKGLMRLQGTYGAAVHRGADNRGAAAAPFSRTPEPSSSVRARLFRAQAAFRRTGQICPVCGRRSPEYQVEDDTRAPLGCERCLTIRRNGVIQI